MGTDILIRDAWRKLALALGVTAIAALALAAAIAVPPDRTALVLRLGQPVRVINGWNTGPGEAGLALRVPVVDRVVWLDRRLMTLTVENTAVRAADGQGLSVDAFAAWRVTDAARFYAALGTPDQANEAMRGIFTAVLRQQLGQGTLADAQGLARGAGNGVLRTALDREWAAYGATATDVRLSRVIPAEGAPLDAALAQLAAHALADAGAIGQEGHRTATLIRAGAEARAVQIYAASFGKDPQFHDFYRAMQSYDATFAQKGSHTTIVLSPDNAYLRQFRGK
jgi:membrane protease subunit HflC